MKKQVNEKWIEKGKHDLELSDFRGFDEEFKKYLVVFLNHKRGVL